MCNKCNNISIGNQIGKNMFYDRLYLKSTASIMFGKDIDQQELTDEEHEEIAKQAAEDEKEYQAFLDTMSSDYFRSIM